MRRSKQSEVVHLSNKRLPRYNVDEFIKILKQIETENGKGISFFASFELSNDAYKVKQIATYKKQLCILDEKGNTVIHAITESGSKDKYENLRIIMKVRIRRMEEVCNNTLDSAATLSFLKQRNDVGKNALEAYNATQNGNLDVGALFILLPLFENDQSMEDIRASILKGSYKQFLGKLVDQGCDAKIKLVWGKLIKESGDALIDIFCLVRNNKKAEKYILNYIKKLCCKKIELMFANNSKISGIQLKSSGNKSELLKILDFSMLFHLLSRLKKCSEKNSGEKKKILKILKSLKSNKKGDIFEKRFMLLNTITEDLEDNEKYPILLRVLIKCDSSSKHKAQECMYHAFVKPNKKELKKLLKNAGLGVPFLDLLANIANHFSGESVELKPIVGIFKKQKETYKKEMGNLLNEKQKVKKGKQPKKKKHPRRSKGKKIQVSQEKESASSASSSSDVTKSHNKPTEKERGGIDEESQQQLKILAEKNVEKTWSLRLQAKAIKKPTLGITPQVGKKKIRKVVLKFAVHFKALIYGGQPRDRFSGETIDHTRNDYDMVSELLKDGIEKRLKSYKAKHKIEKFTVNYIGREYPLFQVVINDYHIDLSSLPKRLNGMENWGTLTKEDIAILHSKGLDFRHNAIYIDPEPEYNGEPRRYLDPQGGCRAITQKIIVPITGDNDSFCKIDPIRMLRGLKDIAYLNFSRYSIQNVKVIEQIRKNLPRLFRSLNRWKFTNYFTKMLYGEKGVELFDLLRAEDLLEDIIPFSTPYLPKNTPWIKYSEKEILSIRKRLTKICQSDSPLTTDEKRFECLLQLVLPLWQQVDGMNRCVEIINKKPDGFSYKAQKAFGAKRPVYKLIYKPDERLWELKLYTERAASPKNIYIERVSGLNELLKDKTDKNIDVDAVIEKITLFDIKENLHNLLSPLRDYVTIKPIDGTFNALLDKLCRKVKTEAKPKVSDKGGTTDRPQRLYLTLENMYTGSSPGLFKYLKDKRKNPQPTMFQKERDSNLNSRERAIGSH